MVLVVLLTAGVVGSATWVVFFSPVLGVREIEVVGNLTVQAAHVEQAAGVPPRHPLATVDLAAVESKVLGIRQVESAEVGRGWPGTLRIEIVERVPIAVIAVAGKSALIDEHGVVTEVRAVAPPRLPVLRVTQPGERDPSTRAALAVLAALPEDLARRVAEVHATSAEGVSLKLADGRTVVWGGADRGEQKARILATLLDRTADIYDVSSPEVVTVK
jgi:cell division protein FtsQ